MLSGDTVVVIIVLECDCSGNKVTDTHQVDAIKP